MTEIEIIRTALKDYEQAHREITSKVLIGDWCGAKLRLVSHDQIAGICRYLDKKFYTHCKRYWVKRNCSGFEDWWGRPPGWCFTYEEVLKAHALRIKILKSELLRHKILGRFAKYYIAMLIP